MATCLSFSARSKRTDKIMPTSRANRRLMINPQWRIYARSASDDKAGVMAILTAFSALKDKGIRTHFKHQVLF